MVGATPPQLPVAANAIGSEALARHNRPVPGVLAVDMETSVMYILGVHRSVPVANLLLISDILSDPWQPAFHHERLDHAMAPVQAAMVQAAGSALSARGQQDR